MKKEMNVAEKFKKAVEWAKQNIFYYSLVEGGFMCEGKEYWQSRYVIAGDNLIKLFDRLYYTIDHINDTKDKEIEEFKRIIPSLFDTIVEFSEKENSWATAYLMKKLNEKEKGDLDDDNVLDVFDYNDPLVWKAHYIGLNDTYNYTLKRFERILNNNDEKIIESYKKNYVANEVYSDNIVERIISLEI